MVMTCLFKRMCCKISFYLFIHLQGRALGVTIGCILGMFPLMFHRNKDAETNEKKQHLDKMLCHDPMLMLPFCTLTAYCETWLKLFCDIFSHLDTVNRYFQEHFTIMVVIVTDMQIFFLLENCCSYCLILCHSVVNN